MFFAMYASKKIDALDLIIEVLKEHEKTLDALIGRLEASIDRFGSHDPAAELRRRFHEPI